MDILSIICLFFYLGRCWGQKQIYVVSAPKTFCVGASENVVIQAYGYTQPFAVTIAIKSYPDRSFTYTSEQVHLSPENEFQNSATLTILPEDLPGGPDAVAHVYLEVASVYFLKATKIPLRYDNGYLFIQTDRPVYDPNQPVKVRVYSLDEDQKPSKREVILTFIDPEGSEVTMEGKQSHTGIINFPDFKIPAYPEYGMWIVAAKYKEDFTTRGLAHFEIKMKRRALFLRKPRFSISIEPENYFITHKNFENFKIIIKASSSYDENVTEADVSVFFGLRNDLGDRKDNMNEATQKTQLINGTAQINFNTSKAIENLPYKSLQDLNNKYLNILVKVKKHTAGGLFEESNVTDVKYILSPYTLHLVAAPPPLKPGIPCSIKVQVKDTFDHSVRGITVALEPKVVDKTQEKRDLAPRKSTTSYDGVASFAVNIPTDVTALEFHVRTDDPDLPEEHQASNDYRVVAYSSPSQSFLSLNWTESYKNLLVGERFSITVTPKSPHVDKITHYNYLIVSKGKIVHFGREKKLPGSSHQILNLPTTQSMVPAAHLLVYYIILGEQGAELVPDSVCLNIEDKCSNQLQIHLLPNRDLRGAVSLIMDTQSESWVALTALNSATYDIQERSKNPKERVLGALYKNDLRCGASGGRTSAEVFCLAGFTVLTNADTEDFQQNDGSCKKILRSRRSWEDLKDLVSQFRHPVIRKCCEDGIRPSRHSCGERAGRITIGPKCVDAFSQCCELREQNISNKYVALGRTSDDTGGVTFSTIGSKSVLENWLWNVYHVPKRSQQELAVPWLPTTWEIQGVSVSDKGLCIADVLHLQVQEEHIQVTRLE